MDYIAYMWKLIKVYHHNISIFLVSGVSKNISRVYYTVITLLMLFVLVRAFYSVFSLFYNYIYSIGVCSHTERADYIGTLFDGCCKVCDPHCDEILLGCKHWYSLNTPGPYYIDTNNSIAVCPLCRGELICNDCVMCFNCQYKP